MKSPELESKRIFLIASGDPQRILHFRKFIDSHVFGATIFDAADGQEALFKIGNVMPHVAFLDAKLDKVDGYEITTKILLDPKNKDTAVVLVADIPESELFVDEVVVSRVQFLQPGDGQREFDRCLTRALNRFAMHEKASYRLRFLGAGDVLFRENEAADAVYFVKKGTLEATKAGESGATGVAGPKDAVSAARISLGRATVGEFVGEMAHFNVAPRSATVTALDEVELIEIPFGVLDMVLFSKPAWAKALVATLSRRLKATNENLVTAG